MKNISMLVWLTQLGMSVAVPLAGFVFLGVWLRQQFDLGIWVLIVGFVLGIICAVNGLRNSLKTMERMAKDKNEKDRPVAYNDHD